MNCKYCGNSATKDVTWADGRGKVSVCDGCVVKAKQEINRNDKDFVGAMRVVDVGAPNTNHFAGQARAQEEAPTRQEPVLNHELSTEDNNRLSPDRKGLRLSLLYDTQHPMNALPPELKRRIELAMTAQETMPSMTNYSNMDAPTPMHPADRPV